MPELAFAVVDIVARAVRRRRRTCWPGCGSRRPPASGCTRSRCGPRSASSRSAAATTTPRSSALLDLFGDRTRFAADAQAVPLAARLDRRAGVHRRRREIDLRAAVHLRLRRLGHHVPARAARRRGPAAVPVQRHRVHPRAPPASPSSRCRGTARRATGMPVAVWRDLMETHFPGTEWLRHAPRHRRGARALPARPRPHQLGRRRRRRCSGQDRGGGAAMTPRPRPARRRRRPLRGVPALPLPRPPRPRTRCAGSSACSARRGRRRPALGEEAGLAVECLLRPDDGDGDASPCTCASSSCSGGTAERATGRRLPAGRRAAGRRHGLDQLGRGGGGGARAGHLRRRRPAPRGARVPSRSTAARIVERVPRRPAWCAADGRCGRR